MYYANTNFFQRPIAEWPEEFVNARLKFLYRVKEREMKILAQLAKGPGNGSSGRNNRPTWRKL